MIIMGEESWIDLSWSKPLPMLLQPNTCRKYKNVCLVIID